MKSLSTLILCFFTLSIQSQILNIEKSSYRNDTTHFFYTDLNASFSAFNRTAASDQPIDFLSINGNLDLAYFSEKNTLIWLNRLAYLDINSSPFNSTAYSHLRFTINSPNTIAYEVFGQGQYDLLRGLDHRVLGGAGLRIRMLEGKKVQMFLGIAGMFEQEKWQDPSEEGVTVTTDFLKSSNYFSTRLELQPYINFNLITYYQVGYDNAEQVARHRINTDTNLEFKLSRVLTFRVSLFTAFENAPVVPITKFTYSISNGLSIKLEKMKK